MHHTMTVAAPARTVTSRWPAVAVKSDVKPATTSPTSPAAMPPDVPAPRPTTQARGSRQGHGKAAAPPCSASPDTVEAEVAERLYQEGMGPHGERIIKHATPKTGEDLGAAEATAVARYKDRHPFASASEILAARHAVDLLPPEQ